LLGFVMLAAAPASAGYRKCTSTQVTLADYNALMGVARRAAKGHELDKLQWACMNPGSGNVLIHGVPEPQPDGTEIHVSVGCDRQPSRWKCEVTTIRHWKSSLTLRGREQKFDVSLPMEMGLEEARSLIRLGLEQGPAMSAQQACEHASYATITPLDEENASDLRGAFTPGEGVFDGEIEIDGNTGTLWSGFELLRFSRPLGGSAWEVRCWSFVVVVT